MVGNYLMATCAALFPRIASKLRALPARPPHVWVPRLLVMLRVRVEQPPNHALILRVVLRGLPFEELDAALAQRQGDLDALFAKHEVLRRRQEVRHHLELAQRLIRVSYFRAHRFVYPYASSLLRGFGSCRIDM